MTIQPGTRAFYDHWAVAGQEAALSAISRHFESAFKPGARVLDVGCGTGRDLAVLRDLGFDAYGVEPHDAMRAQALARHPALAGRIASTSLPQLGRPFGGGFDAIVCSAVLMHLPADALPASFAALDAVLRPQARILLAVPQMQAELLVDGRDPDGRAFANHPPDQIEHLLADHGFAPWPCVEVVTAPGSTSWRVLLFDR